MVSNERLSMIDLIMISLGCAFYGLGLVSVNIANHLAEGGVTGITLIIRYSLDHHWLSLFRKKGFSLYSLWNISAVILDLVLAKILYSNKYS